MTRILMADDETALLEVFCEILASEFPQAEILQARNGEECLQQIRRSQPEVVISDIKMPKKDGLKMLEELRFQGDLTPVILVTGFGDKDMVYRAWKLGAFDFLSKPVDSEALVMAVKTALAFGRSFNRFRHITDQNVTIDATFKIPERLMNILSSYTKSKNIDIHETVTRVLYDFLANKSPKELDLAG